MIGARIGEWYAWKADIMRGGVILFSLVIGTLFSYVVNGNCNFPGFTTYRFIILAGY